MGSRLAKPPPLDRPIAPGRTQNAALARPFPVLTPQSYVPGGTGFYPGLQPPGGNNSFPMLNQNSFLPPQASMEPPIMNFSGGPSMLPPPMPYPPMFPQAMPPPVSFPPPMPYPNENMMSIAPQSQFYEPGLRTFSRRRPVRMCRRRRRSRRCRPVIHVIDSSSCSSLSSYTTISSCSRRRHRSHSHSRRRRRTATPPPQQQQQPIILLPIQCQQQPAAAPVQNSIQQQPQQIILPPIQVQQQGQIQHQQLALPPIPFQQQPLGLPAIQLNPSNFASSTSSSPMIITNGQSMLQPSISMPQFANIGQPQQMQSGAIQYVQAARQSSSPLQYVSAEPRSTIAPQRGLVYSSNKKQPPMIKTVPRSTSTRNVPQNDLKYGRRPFDWYESEKKNNVINENIRIGQRRSTAVN